MKKSFLTRVVVSAFLIVALVLTMGVVAFAQDATPLGGQEISATLQGNTGGAFHHYTLDVPADTEIHIQFWYPGVDPLLSAAVGLAIYGADGAEEGQAVVVEDGDYYEVSFRHDDPQTLTAVVFNYTDRAIPYTLKVVGLPMTAAAPMAQAPAMTLPATGAPADEGGNITDITGAGVSGTLPGNTGGSFAHYTVSVPADSEVHVQFWYPGVDPLLSAAVGVNVFGSDGSEGQVAPVEDGAYYEFSFRHDDPQMLTIVPFNYTSMDIPYTLKVTGLAVSMDQGPADLPPTGTEADDADTADMADTSDDDSLAIGGAAWSGLLVGADGGAFAKIPLMYNGDESDVTITLVFSPSDPSMGDRLGVEVWGPNGKLLGSGTNTAVGGEHKVTFASDESGQYTIVVFNYMEGVPISYSLTATR